LFGNVQPTNIINHYHIGRQTSKTQAHILSQIRMTFYFSTSGCPVSVQPIMETAGWTKTVLFNLSQLTIQIMLRSHTICFTHAWYSYTALPS